MDGGRDVRQAIFKQIHGRTKKQKNAIFWGVLVFFNILPIFFSLLGFLEEIFLLFNFL